MASSPIFPGTIVSTSVSVANADGTTAKTIYTAPTGGARIDKIIATSTDTSNRDMQIAISGNLIGTVAVALSAGTASTVAAKDVLADTNIAAAYDPFGNKVLYLSNGQTLQVIMPVAVTAAKAIVVTVQGGSF